jgi:hypothetical protein
MTGLVSTMSPIELSLITRIFWGDGRICRQNKDFLLRDGNLPGMEPK